MDCLGRLQRCRVGVSAEADTKNTAILHFMMSLLISAGIVHGFYLIIKYPHPDFSGFTDVYVLLYIAVAGLLLINGILSCLLFFAARAKSWRKCLPWLYWNYFILGFIVVSGTGLCIFELFQNNLYNVFIITCCSVLFFMVIFRFVDIVKRFISEISEVERHPDLHTIDDNQVVGNQLLKT